METLRLKNPDVSLAYHQVTPQPTAVDPGNLEVKMMADIHFIPTRSKVAKPGEDDEEGVEGKAAGAAQALQTSVAGLIPPAAWQNHATSVIFSIKLNANNVLRPVRPQVVLLSDVDLPPQQSLQLF